MRLSLAGTAEVTLLRHGPFAVFLALWHMICPFCCRQAICMSRLWKPFIQAAQITTLNSRQRSQLLGASLILAAIIAYLPAVKAGFIWDDDVLLTANSNMQGIAGLGRIWMAQGTCDYTPLTLTAFWSEKRVWGDAAMGFHLDNILLHALSALLVWRIFVRLQIPGGWLAALFFAIHPVNVSSVAWIAERKNTLSAVFFFASVLSYLSFYKSGRTASYVISLLAFALAGLSKGSVVTLPIILSGCVLWMNRKFTRNDFLRVTPFFLIAVAVSVLTIRFQSGGINFGFLPTSLTFRTVRAGAAVWLHLLAILLPIGLSPMRPQWLPDLHSAVVYLPALLLAIVLIVFVWKRKTWGRPLLFISGYYLAMLLPALGFLWMTFQQETPCADWWQYLATPAIFAGIGALIVDILRRGTRNTRFALQSAVGVVLVMITLQTWRRAEIYHSMESYCRAVVAETPHLWTLETNLGVALERRGEFREAIEWQRQALRDNSQVMEAHNNLANCLRASGDLNGSEIEYRAALQLNDSNPTVLANLADVYFQDGKISDALAADAAAIRTDRLNSQRYVDFGNKLVAAKQIEQGIACFRNALVLAPDNIPTDLVLARALFSIGRNAEASTICERALRSAHKIGDERLIQSVTLSSSRYRSAMVQSDSGQ